jgi:hypothetical protein
MSPAAASIRNVYCRAEATPEINAGLNAKTPAPRAARRRSESAEARSE